MFVGFLIVLAGFGFGGYYAYSWYQGDGLAAWVALQSVELTGSVTELATIVIPMGVTFGLIFGGFGVMGNARKAAGVVPRSSAEVNRLLGGWGLILGLITAGAGAYAAMVYAPTLPDGTEAPITIDVATIAEADLPVGQRVQLEGFRDFDYFVPIESTTDGRVTSVNSYVPVLPLGGLSPAKVQFVQFLSGSGSGTPTENQFYEPGYLYKTPLDVLVSDAFVADGLILADNIYSVDSLGGNPQEMWVFGGYIVAAIGAVIAFFALIIWIMGIIGVRRNHRLG